MKNSLIAFVVLLVFSSQAFAEWHYLDKVTKVTIQNDSFYVQGSNASGHVCINQSAYYGTLIHSGSSPGHKEYYALVLYAQAMEKGLACHVTSVDSQGVCVMTNCHIY